MIQCAIGLPAFKNITSFTQVTNMFSYKYVDIHHARFLIRGLFCGVIFAAQINFQFNRRRPGVFQGTLPVVTSKSSDMKRLDGQQIMVRWKAQRYLLLTQSALVSHAQSMPLSPSLLHVAMVPSISSDSPHASDFGYYGPRSISFCVLDPSYFQLIS